MIETMFGVETSGGEERVLIIPEHVQLIQQIEGGRAAKLTMRDGVVIHIGTAFDVVVEWFEKYRNGDTLALSSDFSVTSTIPLEAHKHFIKDEDA